MKAPGAPLPTLDRSTVKPLRIDEPRPSDQFGHFCRLF